MLYVCIYIQYWRLTLSVVFVNHLESRRHWGSFQLFFGASPRTGNREVAEFPARVTVSVEWSEYRATGDWCQGLPVEGCRNDKSQPFAVAIVSAGKLGSWQHFASKVCENAFAGKKGLDKNGQIYVSNLLTWSIRILNPSFCSFMLNRWKQ